jgi:hypothetical protein
LDHKRRAVVESQEKSCGIRREELWYQERRAVVSGEKSCGIRREELWYQERRAVASGEKSCGIRKRSDQTRMKHSFRRHGGGGGSAVAGVGGAGAGRRVSAALPDLVLIDRLGTGAGGSVIYSCLINGISLSLSQPPSRSISS